MDTNSKLQLLIVIISTQGPKIKFKCTMRPKEYGQEQKSFIGGNNAMVPIKNFQKLRVE